MGRVNGRKKDKEETSIVDIVEDVLKTTEDIHLFQTACFSEFFVAFAGKSEKEQSEVIEKIRAVLHGATVGSEKSA